MLVPLDTLPEINYFRTGDVVKQKGPYIKILGRRSEVINVGGEKVYPAEIENVLKDLPNVVDVAVGHERHAIAGNLVTARFTLAEIEGLNAFKQRLHAFCRERLAPFQIPRKVVLTRQAAALKNFDSSAWAGSLRMPTLVVDSAEDHICGRADADRLAGLIRGARRITLSGGHASPLERPAELARALLCFFRPLLSQG